MSEQPWGQRIDEIEAIAEPVARARAATIAMGDLADERSALRRERQAAVVELRQTKSLAEVGADLGLHRNRVQQISEGRTGGGQARASAPACPQCVGSSCCKHHQPGTPCYYCDHVRKVVDAAPPLTERQRTVIAGIFASNTPSGPWVAHGSAPVIPSARPRPIERVALYRHWDADGVLLYVGISSDPRLRTRTHRRHSVWTEFAVREEIEWHADRELASDAEREAIVAEKPLFNGTHTTPEAQAACVDYLIKHGRTDLLRFGS